MRTVSCSSELARLQVALDNQVEAANWRAEHQAAVIANLQTSLGEEVLARRAAEAKVEALERELASYRPPVLKPAAQPVGWRDGSGIRVVHAPGCGRSR
jgi:hypothetical protein